MSSRILLILDIDETLIRASRHELDTKPDFILYEYYIYKRPYLDLFLRECSTYYDLAIWSSAGKHYVKGIVDKIMPDSIKLKHVWDISRCVYHRSRDVPEIALLKDLRKLKKKGHSLQKMLIIENSPGKVKRNYGNAIYVKDFIGDPEDNELLLLKEYLKTMHDKDNVRKIEKRNWRTDIKLRREENIKTRRND